MRGFFTIVGGVVAVMVFVTVMAVWSSGVNLWLKRTFGVADANADRQIFEQSQSYNEGMLQDLQHLQQQYVVATADQKQALRVLTLHRFAAYDVNQLPPDLASFYHSLQMGAQ